MNLFRFLFRNARGLTLFSASTALISGACNAALIALVSTVLNRAESPGPAIIWAFAALALSKLGANFAAQVVLAKFSQTAIADMRLNLVRKILAVPLRRLEELGAPRLMVALTEDVLSVAESLLMLPNFAVNLSTLAGGAAYLCWHSWRMGLGIFGLILCGAAGYRFLVIKGFEWLRQAREESDKLFSHFRALTEGIKELKLHRSRRGKFLSDCVQTSVRQFAGHNFAAEIRFILAQAWSQFLFLLLLGLMLFLLPSVRQVNPRDVINYVVIVLWLLGPLTGVLSVMSAFGRANVALKKIDQLANLLDLHSTEDLSSAAPATENSFERLDLVGVTHSYHNEKDDSHFMIGPMNLTFRPGEVVFIIGGNGSGKSTLAKIITGLYPPESGQVCLDGRAITNGDQDNFRQLFSAVFADFYVFETLLGLDGERLDGQAQRYLAELHLDHKVKIRNGRLSTVSLSQGQRKRLALLTAYLEDRPFYLFDEWASDQDPQFKDTFYREILPSLKRRGKAVVVITHDDRYFAFADRLIKLDYGKVIHDMRTSPIASEPKVNGHKNGALALAAQDA